MRILICDDEQTYLELLQIHVEEYMQEHQVCYSMTALTDATQIAEDAIFDLAFLDIQMPEINGITLAKKLRSHNSKIALFFVTNFDEYQDDAMDVQAFRFFEKPFSVARLYAGLNKAMEYIDGAYVDLYLSDGMIQQRIIADEIRYVTRNGRKVSVFTKDNTFYVSNKYDEVCNQLPQLFFYPVHKSFFVNLHDVDQYSYTELFLTDGTRIAIAPRRQVAFHKFWFEYLRRR